MTNQESTTQESNLLIAEFMGVKIGVDNYSWRPGCFEPLKVEHLAYHNNWSWLMPVVEKMTGIPYESEEVDNGFGVKVTVVQRPYLRTFGMINDENGHYMVRFNRCALHMASTLIEATYSAVVEFIKLYNLPSSEEEAREWDFHQKLP